MASGRERSDVGARARHALRVAGYRFRTTLRRRWGGYLSLILCIGFLGGMAMGAIAGARRTQSSFTSYFANANPPDLVGISAVLNPSLGSASGYSQRTVRAIAHLAHVAKVENGSGIDVLPLTRAGVPYVIYGFPPGAGNGQGSDDGLYFDFGRVSIVAGRMADPRRVDEVMMMQVVARDAHVHVGATFRVGIYTNAQTQLARFGTARVHPFRVVTVKLVGTFIQPQSLIQDDVDASTSEFFFTPAFTRPLLSCCANYTATAIKVTGGSRFVPVVDAEVQHLLPKGFPVPALVSTAIAKAQRAIQPESIALGVFGLIAALATLLIAGQVIGRQIRLSRDDLEKLRALGAEPSVLVVDSSLGIVAASVVGSALATAMAVALSPLSPIGPVRPVYPHPGVAVDAWVLGIGFVGLVVVLTSLAVFLAARQAPHLEAARRRRGGGVRVSRTSRAAASAGFPPQAVTGIRFALEPGAGRNAVPVRSAIVGAVLAIAVIVATTTFGASLNSLVTHPNLYGWNWNYILSAGGGSGNIPRQPALTLLNRDPLVGAWAGAYFDDLSIDGQSVPVIGESPGASVQPPILSGHRLQRPNEILLGAITMAQLHKQVGDTVLVTSGLGPPTPLRIVGTATMPTIGGPGPHLEMGTGAVLNYELIPAAARNPFNDPITGPESIFVNARSGASLAALATSLHQISGRLSNNANFGVFVQSVLRPAEIVNYRSMGTTPALLGTALCIGALMALALTLMASVRRRRRDLALLKALGFTRRQLASTIAWQSTIAMLIGVAIGIPVGIAAGRSLWDLFAGEIHAVPAPSVPTSSVALIVVGSLVLANLVAWVPGVVAARTRTADLLRAE